MKSLRYHLTFPYSWVGHIPFASALIREFQPSVVVELGTHTGNSYLAMCQSIQENQLPTKAFAVDTWQGDEHAEFYGEEVFHNLKAVHDPQYSDFSTLLRTTFDEAVDQFKEGEIDLLHIDGLHTYEAVKHDFETWLPKLSKNAIVLFHDTCVKERDFGVWKFWEEVSETYPFHLNFSHSNGLGVLCLSKPQPLWLIDFFQHQTTQSYETRGNQLIFHANLKDVKAVAGDALPSQTMQLAKFYDLAVHEYNLSLQKYAGTIEEKQLLTQQNQTLTEQNHELKQEMEVLRHENQDLAEENQAIQIKFEQLLNSRSIQFTKPLRVIGQKIRKMANHPYMKNLHFLFKKHGFFTLIKKSIHTFKQDGVKEVLRKAFPLQQSNISITNDYAKYFQNDFENRKSEITNWLANISNMNTPLISIVMPVYNPPIDIFKEAVQSVQHQMYPNWELCICNDASTDSAIRPILDQLTHEDSRIKVIHHSQNQHISIASNSAISLASGDFIALMDNDDLLPEDALAWVAKEIIEHPEAQIIYSDEDKIGLDGQLCNPYFKSDWNFELFMSQNMISHLGVYSRELVTQVGGFRHEFIGSQDYDLALRCISKISPSQIRHIPKVLYHWRIIEGSTALEQAEKPYTITAALSALNEFLRINNLPGKIEEFKYGQYRWHPEPIENEPLVSIIIPTKNQKTLVENCINSLLQKTSYQNYEILLVDNGSDDKDAIAYFESLKSHSKVRVIHDPQSFNYSAINNQAVQKANGEFVLLLNNDTEVIEPNWLTEMVFIALREGVGAVGAKLLYPDNRVQHGGVIVGLGGVAGHAHHLLDQNDPGYFGRAINTQVVSAVTAACLLVRKSIYLKVGGLNETDLKVAFNDVDFCLKVMKAGYRNVWTPFALLYHHESVSRGYEDTPEKQARFAGEVAYMESTWAELLQKDPFYNPNLSLKTPYALKEDE